MTVWGVLFYYLFLIALCSALVVSGSLFFLYLFLVFRLFAMKGYRAIKEAVSKRKEERLIIVKLDEEEELWRKDMKQEIMEDKWSGYETFS